MSIVPSFGFHLTNNFRSAVVRERRRGKEAALKTYDDTQLWTPTPNLAKEVMSDREVTSQTLSERGRK